MLASLLLPWLLAGCDATGASSAERGRFTASFRGAADVDFRGEAVHEGVEGEALLQALTNFSIRLTDRNWSSTRRAIYFARRDVSRLAPGTYALINLSGSQHDLSAVDPSHLDPERVWGYVAGVDDQFWYSLGGELRIEEASGERLSGTFQFPAAPLSGISQADTVWVAGTFESLRRRR
jgi:hypothetical protein